MMFSIKLLLALSAVATAASAAAVRAADIVFSPAITVPQAGVVWTVGSTQEIAWDISSIPPANENQTGLILLGYVEDGQLDEHLDVGAYLPCMCIERCS